MDYLERKKFTKDITDLKRIIRSLQKDASEQLTLEVESQKTFDYMKAQIDALRGAFNTLSEVLLSEVETLRTEQSQHLDALGEEVANMGRSVKRHRLAVDERLATIVKQVEMLDDTVVQQRQRVRADLTTLHENLEVVRGDTIKTRQFSEEQSVILEQARENGAKSRQGLNQVINELNVVRAQLREEAQHRHNTEASTKRWAEAAIAEAKSDIHRDLASASDKARAIEALVEATRRDMIARSDTTVQQFEASLGRTQELMRQSCEALAEQQSILQHSLDESRRAQHVAQETFDSLSDRHARSQTSVDDMMQNLMSKFVGLERKVAMQQSELKRALAEVDRRMTAYNQLLTVS